MNSNHLNAASGPFTTRFIVTPYGRAGFNIENPRATLDIKSLNATNFPALIIGRQAFNTTNKTQHMHFVPFLSNGGYNGISKSGDLGLFYTDGLDSLGSNKNSGFIIAPWAFDTMGGLRLDKNGNISVGCNSSYNYKMAVNGKVIIKDELVISNSKVNWPDYVFEAYSQGDDFLFSIDSLDNFIKREKHLPYIPAASEIQKNGIYTSQMFENIVKQVEILSVQIIELNKIVESQQRIIEELNAKSK